MGSAKSSYEWLLDQAKVSEPCFYWKMILDFQMKFHVFIRSIREGNFDLYIESSRALVIWCFMMDKYNYARWLTVHNFELITMHVKHPDVYKNLKKGFLSFQKSNKEFSRMALDQVQEQNNTAYHGKKSNITKRLPLFS